MDKQDDRMVPYINEYLEKNGMTSFSELQDKLAAALTPEQQKQYQDVRATLTYPLQYASFPRRLARRQLRQGREG